MESALRLQLKNDIRKFAGDVIEQTKDKVTVQTASKLMSVTEDINLLIKPEIVTFLSKQNATIEKYFGIPKNVPITELGDLQNSAEIDEYEARLMEQMAELEKIYKQQAIMMLYLSKENELYQQFADIGSDAELCDSFENNFSRSKNETEECLSATEQLDALSIRDSESGTIIID